jgi:hypothetical protein
LIFFQKDPRTFLETSQTRLADLQQPTYFADVVQDLNHHLEVPDVECWKGEANVAKMPIALLKVLPAGLA